MASELQIYIDQGATYSQQMTINDDSGNPVDLTTASLISQIRRSYTSTTFYSFTISAVDLVNGIISFNLSSAQTQSLSSGRYVYDAFYTIGNKTVKIMKGTLTVYPSVSKV